MKSQLETTKPSKRLALMPRQQNTFQESEMLKKKEKNLQGMNNYTYFFYF